jgi:hypothetical protein
MVNEFLCKLEHRDVAIIVLLLVVILFGAGRSLGNIIMPLVKRLFGKGEVIVNVGTTEKHAEGFCVDPEKCPAHQYEKDRSLRNETNIGKLFDKIEHVKDCVEEGNKQVSKEIGDMKIEIIKSLATIIREGMRDNNN